MSLKMTGYNDENEKSTNSPGKGSSDSVKPTVAKNKTGKKKLRSTQKVIQDKRITFSALFLTIFSVVLCFSSLGLLFSVITFHDNPEPDDDSKGVDTIYVADQLSSGFLRAIEACKYFGSAEQVVYVPIKQVVQEAGVVAIVVDVFTSVELEMFALVPVCVSAGIDAEKIEIEHTITDGRVTYMKVSIPDAEILGARIQYDSVETRFEEGSIRNTAQHVLSFIDDTATSSLEIASHAAVESGLLEIAEQNAKNEIRRLLMELGVENVEVVSGAGRAVQVACVDPIDNEGGVE